ncbi:hypothetical protein HN51_008522 [Arachis hypogaea]|uniref:uncharacterized protein n=1 Tax=Arachis hypogaea TaxID=3818 RepID=UPI003B222963|nr:putative NAD(P)H dehydrogenase (quinone) FQR1-like [Arachis hypogaea]
MSQTVSIPRDNTSTDDITKNAQASSNGVAAAATRLRIFIKFYSMYGHVEGLARRLKKGVDDVEGVEVVLYRVLELLPAEIQIGGNEGEFDGWKWSRPNGGHGRLTSALKT